jgi:hypothetical protein
MQVFVSGAWWPFKVRGEVLGNENMSLVSGTVRKTHPTDNVFSHGAKDATGALLYAHAAC